MEPRAPCNTSREYVVFLIDAVPSVELRQPLAIMLLSLFRIWYEDLASLGICQAAPYYHPSVRPGPLELFFR